MPTRRAALRSNKRRAHVGQGAAGTGHKRALATRFPNTVTPPTSLKTLVLNFLVPCFVLLIGEPETAVLIARMPVTYATTNVIADRLFRSSLTYKFNMDRAFYGDNIYDAESDAQMQLCDTLCNVLMDTPVKPHVLERTITTLSFVYAKSKPTRKDEDDYFILLIEAAEAALPILAPRPVRLNASESA